VAKLEEETIENGINQEKWTMSSLARWSTLALLALGAMIAFIDRTNISSALAVDTFKAYFELSDLDRGWINSAFFWTYAIFQMPMGYIVDRYGVKYPYAICFTLWCIASACMGLMTAMWGLILLRLFIGVTESIVTPATYRWIRTNFEPTKSGMAVGLYMMGNKLGPAVGAPLAAWLIIAFDWRLMFIITGLAGMVWLIPWMLLTRNDLPRFGDRAQAKKTAAEVPFRNIFSSPTVWGTLVVNFCYAYFTFFAMTWMPAYLVEQRGLSLKEMGLYTFFTFIGIAIVAFITGTAADKLVARYGRQIMIRKIFVVTGFVLASTVLLGARAETLEEALFWNVFSLSGLGFASSNNIVLSTLTLIPKQVVGFVKGFQNSATALAGIVSPLVTGWLLHVTGSYVAPMTLIFVFLVVGAVTVIFVLRPEWSPRVENDDSEPATS